MKSEIINVELKKGEQTYIFIECNKEEKILLKPVLEELGIVKEDE